MNKPITPSQLSSEERSSVILEESKKSGRVEKNDFEYLRQHDPETAISLLFSGEQYYTIISLSHWFGISYEDILSWCDTHSCAVYDEKGNITGYKIENLSLDDLDIDPSQYEKWEEQITDQCLNYLRCHAPKEYFRIFLNDKDWQMLQSLYGALESAFEIDWYSLAKHSDMITLWYGENLFPWELYIYQRNGNEFVLQYPFFGDEDTEVSLEWVEEKFQYQIMQAIQDWKLIISEIYFWNIEKSTDEKLISKIIDIAAMGTVVCVWGINIRSQNPALISKIKQQINNKNIQVLSDTTLTSIESDLFVLYDAENDSREKFSVEHMDLTWQDGKFQKQIIDRINNGKIEVRTRPHFWWLYHGKSTKEILECEKIPWTLDMVWWPAKDQCDAIDEIYAKKKFEDSVYFWWDTNHHKKKISHMKQGDLFENTTNSRQVQEDNREDIDHNRNIHDLDMLLNYSSSLPGYLLLQWTHIDIQIRALLYEKSGRIDIQNGLWIDEELREICIGKNANASIKSLLDAFADDTKEEFENIYRKIKDKTIQEIAASIYNQAQILYAGKILEDCNIDGVFMPHEYLKDPNIRQLLDRIEESKQNGKPIWEKEFQNIFNKIQDGGIMKAAKSLWEKASNAIFGEKLKKEDPEKYFKTFLCQKDFELLWQLKTIWREKALSWNDLTKEWMCKINWNRLVWICWPQDLTIKESTIDLSKIQEIQWNFTIDGASTSHLAKGLKVRWDLCIEDCGNLKTLNIEIADNINIGTSDKLQEVQVTKAQDITIDEYSPRLSKLQLGTVWDIDIRHSDELQEISIESAKKIRMLDINKCSALEIGKFTYINATCWRFDLQQKIMTQIDPDAEVDFGQQQQSQWDINILLSLKEIPWNLHIRNADIALRFLVRQAMWKLNVHGQIHTHENITFSPEIFVWKKINVPKFISIYWLNINAIQQSDIRTSAQIVLSTFFEAYIQDTEEDIQSIVQDRSMKKEEKETAIVKIDRDFRDTEYTIQNLGMNTDVLYKNFL